MSNPQRTPIAVRTGLRLLAIVAAWLALVASGTVMFWAPRATEGQPVGNDLISFACSLAIAGAVAAAIALAINGEWKWAAELGVAVVLAVGVSIATGFVLLWVDPWTLRNYMDAWSFLRLRDVSGYWAKEILMFESPFAAGVGSVVGFVGGLLLRLARWSTRSAAVTGLGLLVTCATDSVRESLFGFLNQCGWTLHVQFGTPWMTPVEIAATGAVLGSLTGTGAVGLLIYLARRVNRSTAT